MALGDNIKKANEDLKDFKSKLVGLDDAIASIGQSIATDIQDQIKGADKITQDFAKSFTQDLSQSIKKSGKELDAIDSIQKKINAGQDASKEIIKDGGHTRVPCALRISRSSSKSFFLVPPSYAQA